MEEYPQINNSIPFLEKTACPYLKLWNDTTIRFGYPHQANYCHYISPPQGVTLDYQMDYCLNINNPYWMCSLINLNKKNFLQDGSGRSPFIRIQKRNKKLKWLFGLVFVVSLGLILFMFNSKIDLIFWMLCFELLFVSVWGFFQD